MLRAAIATTIFALVSSAALPVIAGDIQSLQGQFAFDWHTDPEKTQCAAVDAQLLTRFKSDAFQCELNVATNTASGEPARVCTQTGGDAEYLIFETEKSCEHERLTQVSNGDG